MKVGDWTQIHMTGKWLHLIDIVDEETGKAYARCGLSQWAKREYDEDGLKRCKACEAAE